MIEIEVSSDNISRTTWDSEGPTVHFIPEFLDWLRTQACEPVTYYMSGVDNLTLKFHNTRDALLFKLRWGGQ